MKWFIAFVVSIVLSALLISGISAFNSLMERRIVEWQDANFALGIIPQLAVNLHYILVKNIFIVIPLVIILTFTISFIIVGKKK